jgi:hypothetical protein
MLNAWNRRVRMTSAMINAATMVRTVSTNPSCQRFLSLDTLMIQECSRGGFAAYRTDE